MEKIKAMRKEQEDLDPRKIGNAEATSKWEIECAIDRRKDMLHAKKIIEACKIAEPWVVMLVIENYGTLALGDDFKNYAEQALANLKR